MTTVFTESDSDSSSTTGTSGPTTLGTTTSTVTTATPTTGGASSTTDDTSGTTDDTSTTSDDPCNYDGTCDEDGGEDLINCLHDCGSCEVDETCDNTIETPSSCPVDCPATSCDFNGEVDPLTEQCDDGNDDDEDACTKCTLNVCGDNILNKAEDSSEECDDGNEEDGDGCSHQCLREIRTVFVSSITFFGSLQPAIGDVTGGVALADAHCQALAEEANLVGTYMAWLSDKNVGPADRFGIPDDFAGRYELTTGETVAEGWAELRSGTLSAPINVDENTEIIGSAVVWTNTKADGTPRSADDCGGWNWKEGDDGEGNYGSSSKADGEWTEGKATVPCFSEGRLYCFQVE